MSFRDFLKTNLINLVKLENIPKLIFFQIGCFPNSQETADHEYPEVIEHYKKEYPNIKIYQVLIDKIYNCQEYNSYCIEDNENKKLCQKNCYNSVVKTKYNNEVFVYPKYITESEYNTIVELCHFMSNFNTISIIMEFTSIIREAYYDIKNMTDYLYICPSECQVSTSHKLFRPIILYKNNNYVFFRPDREKSLYHYLNQNVNDEKMDFILADLSRRKDKINYFKCFLNMMRMDLKYGDIPLEKNYNKSYPHFYLIIKNIKYRLSGYDKESTEILLNNFNDSEEKNLETYIYDLLFSILYDILVFKYKSEVDIQNNYYQILFSNDDELKKCIENLNI